MAFDIVINIKKTLKLVIWHERSANGVILISIVKFFIKIIVCLGIPLVKAFLRYDMAYIIYWKCLFCPLKMR